MLSKLDFLETRFTEIGEKISDPAVIADQDTWRKLMKEHADLSPIVEKYREYRNALQTVEEATQMIAESDDRELKELAQEFGAQEEYRVLCKLAGLGREYTRQIEDEVVRLCLMLELGVEEAVLRSMAKSVAAEDLLKFRIFMSQHRRILQEEK